MESYPIGSSPEALPARSDGPASAEPLVLLHGFTQTGASWAPLREPLGKTFRLLSPDLPGHGAASRVSADLWQTADLLGATLTRAGAMCATWVGYSMGGRAALHLALAHPGLVSKLVLVSTSAGIEDDQERAARRQRDEALAKRIELGGDEGLGGFLAEWLSQPLFATLPPERAGLNERLANSAAGLASSLRLAGAGAQDPLWHRLPELAARPIPVLLVAGELDSTYRRHAERMAGLIGPSAAVKLIAGAGHACHLERPEAFAQQVLSFCNPGAS